MTSAHRFSHDGDGEPPNLHAGRQQTEALIALLLMHRVERPQVLAELKLDEAGLQLVLSGAGPTGSLEELIGRLRELCRRSFPFFGPFLAENAVAIDLLERLDTLGLRQNQIAERLSCSSSHLSRVRGGEHRATEELVDQLDRLHGVRVAELLAATGNLPAANVTFVAADQNRAAGLDPTKEADITASVRAGALRALAGQAEPTGVPLPNGFLAVTCEIGPGQWVVALDLAQCGDATGKVKAHEWRALARHFEALARATERGSNRGRRKPPPRSY